VAAVGSAFRQWRRARLNQPGQAKAAPRRPAAGPWVEQKGVAQKEVARKIAVPTVRPAAPVLKAGATVRPAAATADTLDRHST